MKIIKVAILSVNPKNKPLILRIKKCPCVWKECYDENDKCLPELFFVHITECRTYRRWRTVEPIIAQDPSYAYYYANEVVLERWPEGEQAILKNPFIALDYAENILNKRWPKAEPIIMTNAECAYYYARDIIKGRWPKAESIIMNSPIAEHYINYLKNKHNLI